MTTPMTPEIAEVILNTYNNEKSEQHSYSEMARVRFIGARENMLDNAPAVYDAYIAQAKVVQELIADIRKAMTEMDDNSGNPFQTLKQTLKKAGAL